MYVGGNLFYKSFIRNLSLILIIYLLGVFDQKVFLSIKFFALNFILLTSLIVGSRLFLRDLLYRLNLFKQKKPNVIIYGAGNAGAQLASSIQISGKYKVLGFIDDSSSVIGRELCGIKIYSFEDIEKFSNIDHVLIAIPSLDKSERRRIIESLKF